MGRMNLPGVSGIPWADKDNPVITKLDNSTTAYDAFLEVSENDYILESNLSNEHFKVDRATNQIWKVVYNSTTSDYDFYKVDPVNLNAVYFDSIDGDRIAYPTYGLLIYENTIVATATAIDLLNFYDINTSTFGTRVSSSVGVITSARLIQFEDEEVILVMDGGDNKAHFVDVINKSVTYIATIQVDDISKNTYSNRYVTNRFNATFYIRDSSLTYIESYSSPYGGGDAGQSEYNPNTEKVLIVTSDYGNHPYQGAVSILDKNYNPLIENDYNPDVKWAYLGNSRVLGDYFYYSCQHAVRGMTKMDSNGNVIWDFSGDYFVDLDTINRIVFNSGPGDGKIVREASIKGYIPKNDLGDIVLLNTSMSKEISISNDRVTFNTFRSGDELSWTPENVLVSPSDLSELEYCVRVK